MANLKSDAKISTCLTSSGRILWVSTRAMVASMTPLIYPHPGYTLKLFVPVYQFLPISPRNSILGNCVKDRIKPRGPSKISLLARSPLQTASTESSPARTAQDAHNAFASDPRKDG